MAIKNLTYRNLMSVIRKIQKKGYDFKSSEKIARRIFDEYLSSSTGKSIEQRISCVLTKEEYDRLYQ